MFALLFKNLAVSAVPFFISSPFSLLAVVTNCVQLTLKVAAQCGCFRAASTNCAHLADLKLQCPFPRCSRQPGFCQNADDLLSFFTLSVHRAAKEMQSSRVPVALNSVFCFVHRSLFFLLYICGIIIRGLRRLRVTFFFFFFPTTCFAQLTKCGQWCWVPRDQNDCLPFFERSFWKFCCFIAPASYIGNI